MDYTTTHRLTSSDFFGTNLGPKNGIFEVIKKDRKFRHIGKIWIFKVIKTVSGTIPTRVGMRKLFFCLQVDLAFGPILGQSSPIKKKRKFRHIGKIWIFEVIKTVSGTIPTRVGMREQFFCLQVDLAFGPELGPLSKNIITTSKNSQKKSPAKKSGPPK